MSQEDFATRPRKYDLFLLGLLIASLALNVYLGWNVKRLKSIAADQPETPQLAPGTVIKPVTAFNLNGKQETISYAAASNPTVFYIFTTKCGWCERNTQNINAIADLRGSNFRVVGLALDNEDLTKYIEAHHFTFPVYRGLTDDSMRMLGVGGTPQTIVVSPEGRVLKNWVGAFGTRTQSEVEKFFNVQLPGLTTVQTNQASAGG
jgi:peroxiredoxin